MATIDEVAGQTALQTDKEIAENLLPQQEGIIEQEVQSKGFDIFGFLMTETGQGPIEDYIDHPLNRNGSRGVAQMLRGFAGFVEKFFGTNGAKLKLAIADIAFGFMGYREEKGGIR